MSDRVETTGGRVGQIEADNAFDRPDPGTTLDPIGLDPIGTEGTAAPGFAPAPFHQPPDDVAIEPAHEPAVEGVVDPPPALEAAIETTPESTPKPTATVDPVSLPVEPRMWQRRVEVLREQGRRRLRWIIAALVGVVIAAAVLVALHSPVLAVRHVTVVGAHQTPVGDVVGAAALDGRPLVDIDTGETAARVESLPWVAHATVVRSWPTGVTITIVERVPRATVDRPNGVAVVDASGHVLEWTQEPPSGFPSLGAVVAPGRPGTVLGPGARPALMVVDALPAPLAPTVRRVVLDRGHHVWLDLGRGVSAALGGTGDIGAKLQSLASVLASARPSWPAVIDVTVPDLPTVGPPSPGAPPWRRSG